MKQTEKNTRKILKNGGKYSMYVKSKETRAGITLIALVVTIIVLLILAGISISMLSGDNSILRRAGEAKEATETASAKEQIQMEVLGSYSTENLKLDKDKLKTNLGKIGATVTGNDFPLVVTLNGQTYTVDNNGNVEIQEKVDRTGINVGDYINFEPDTDYDGEGNPVAKTYSKDYLAEKYTGYADSIYNNTDLEQAPLKWQVLKIYEDGSMKLIGSETSIMVRLYDATAYNNAVWILNDICEQLYSKKSVGITARSVNIEDLEDDDYYVSETKGNWRVARDNYINEQILARKTELENGSAYIEAVDTTNNTVTYKKNYSWYPNLYAQENGSGIDTTTVKTNGITRSDKYATSREMLDTSTGNNAIKQASNYLTTKYTGYEIDINDTNYGDAHKALTGNCYWLASRDVVCDSNRAKFGIYRIIGNKRYFLSAVASDRGNGWASAFCRPIVAIGPNVKITPSETASDSEGTPHEITSYK